MTQVFISYKREDQSLTLALAHDLEAVGFTVWWDTRMLTGDSIDQVIMDAIDTAQAAIVIWTPNSVGSNWVKSEARRANRQGKLLPVRVPELDESDIPPPFDNYHTALISNRENIKAALAERDILPRQSNTAFPVSPVRKEPPLPTRLPYEPIMVPLKPGVFLMGSPEDELRRYRVNADRKKWETPQRPIKITRPFAIGRDPITFSPITFSEWNIAVAHRACYKPSNCGWEGGGRPVINVSWDDAQAYVNWLRGKTSRPYRLPTEAEWEYACRAGKTEPFYFGHFIDLEYANFRGKWLYDHPPPKRKDKTVEVQECRENAFGLRGMHGNVWEWVEDPWHDSYDRAPTTQDAWTKDSTDDPDLRVIRGGSWKTVAKHVRSATRGKCPKSTRADNIGFRVALDL